MHGTMTRITGKTVAMAIMAIAAGTPETAVAQTASDLVVMRRAIAPPRVVAEPTAPSMGSCTDYHLNSAYSFFPKPSGSAAKYTTVGVRTVAYGKDGNLTASSLTLLAQACATAPATAYCYAGKQSATTVGVAYTLESDLTFAGWPASSGIAVAMKCVK